MTAPAFSQSLGDCQHILPVNNGNNHELGIRYRRIATFALFWLATFMFSLLLLALSPWPPAHYTNRTLIFKEKSFKITKTPVHELEKLWAQYSPYYAAREYQNPPPGCRVSQVRLWKL